MDMNLVFARRKPEVDVLFQKKKGPELFQGSTNRCVFFLRESHAN